MRAGAWGTTAVRAKLIDRSFMRQRFLRASASAATTPRSSREPEPDPKVQQLMAMGFEQAACEGALRTEGSVEDAAEKLLARKHYE